MQHRARPELLAQPANEALGEFAFLRTKRRCVRVRDKKVMDWRFSFSAASVLKYNVL
jgi:hypothetical protein